MKEQLYLMRKHEFIPHDTGTKCKYCHSFTTKGGYAITQCSLRFNNELFRKYLNFRNLSPDLQNPNVLIRRFANITFDLNQIMVEFIEATISTEEAQSSLLELLSESYFSQPNF